MTQDQIGTMRKSIEIFQEASFSSVINNIKDEIGASLGSDRAQGNLDRKALSKTLKSEYEKFLGRTNQDSSPETLKSFLMDVVGFNEENTNKILSDAGLITSESINEALSGNTLDLVFDKASELAFRKGVVPGINNNQSSSVRKKKEPKDSSSRHSDDSKQEKSKEEPSVKKDSQERSLDVSKLISEIGKRGLDEQDIRNLAFAVSKKSFEQVMSEKSIENKNQLSAIGYSVLKVLAKK